MASMQSYVVHLTFLSGPSEDVTITGTGSCSFDTRVIEAARSVHGFSVSYGQKDNEVKTMGASVDSVVPTGKEVDVRGSLQLVDASNHKIDKDSSSIPVLVVAWCEEA